MDDVLVALFQAVEEDGVRERLSVTKGAAELIELLELLREEQSVQGRTALVRVVGDQVSFLLFRYWLDGDVARRAALKDLVAQRWPATRRVPSSPRRNAMTESGMSYLVGLASKSAGSTPAPTRCRAKSPTTLEDGVTLVGRPSISLTAA